jgi:hypothetical protein
VSNPLLAQKQDSTNWHTGINLLDGTRREN